VKGGGSWQLISIQETMTVGLPNRSGRLWVSVPEGVFFPFFRTPPFVIPQEKELIP